MAVDPLDFARLVPRLYRLLGASAGAGALIALFVFGPVWTASFLLGVAGAFLNLRFLQGVAAALGTDGKRPLRGNPFLLAIRFLFVAVSAFVILRFLGVVWAAVLAGLMVIVVAILLEAFYELILLNR